VRDSRRIINERVAVHGRVGPQQLRISEVIAPLPCRVACGGYGAFTRSALSVCGSALRGRARLVRHRQPGDIVRRQGKEDGVCGPSWRQAR